MVTCHNRLRDVLVEYCHLADVLIPNWSLGKPVALDLTVTLLINAEIISKASVTAGSAAYAAEQRKHIANDHKCNELGWVCVSLAVELYGC